MKIVFTMFFLAFNWLAFSQPTGFTKVENSAALEKEIEAHSAKLISITSDFIQEKTMAYLDEVIVSKGKFWYKRDNNLRWQYNEPFEYVIGIKNGQFSIKDQGKVRVFDVSSNPAFKELNDLILSIAKGNLIQDNRFAMEAFEDKTTYFLKLTPKDANMKKFIQQTDLYISKQDGVATKVIMRESDTDYTIISFVNRHLNDAISDTVFDIK
ncbi:MAG TPA: outer membrane lipoprotein carrier protein LolA [Marinilabiliaceae bacterium]|nr:outer membrane lipoprotein carrier protein LolA [Marinilabiliaceae bacterium]